MRITPDLSLVASLQFGLGSNYDCHVYAIRAPEGVVLIDSGSGWQTEKMLSTIREEFPASSIVAVILTHAHPDHCGGAGHLQKLTGCAVYCPTQSVGILRTADENACGLRETRDAGIYPEELSLVPCAAVTGYSDGERFVVSGQEFRAIHVRGHSEDSHCLMTETRGQRALFSGDAVFYGAVLGVINRHDSGMQGYRLDLPKLAPKPSMPGVDGLYPGHGLFTIRGGQRHIDRAIEECRKGFLPRQIGQLDLIF